MGALPIGNVWGIGPNTTAYLQKFGVRTALDFVRKDETWVRTHLSKPFVETWQELHGEVVHELSVDGRHTYQSISKTKTFTPPSSDPSFVLAQLSKNVENACIKARRWNLVTTKVCCFLKTQDFHYHACEVRLPRATALPHEILRELKKHVPALFKKGVQYRATGIVLLDLAEDEAIQLDLFGSVAEAVAQMAVFRSVDEMARKYGKHAIFLGSSFEAVRFGAHVGERGDVTDRVKNLFRGETKRRHLGLPMLGEVR